LGKTIRKPTKLKRDCESPPLNTLLKGRSDGKEKKPKGVVMARRGEKGGI
jgi:hypothetical protein